MDFRLYFLVCVVAISASCLQLDAKSHKTVDKCPITSGPSILNQLDVDNAGVERLVVYFYRAKNSRHIVPFIPSREYQDCFEDIAEEAGEAQYSTLNIDTIQQLFTRSHHRTIRYVIKHLFGVTESPGSIWTQLWGTYPDNHGSHELDETHNADETGHDTPTDFPEHDNDAPLIRDIDAVKLPDWQIPVQEPDREMNTGELDVSATVSSENNTSTQRPDRKEPLNLDVNIIEPTRPDENLVPNINDNIEVSVIMPDEPLVQPNHPDDLQPTGPIENDTIKPDYSDDNNRTVVIRDENEAPVIRPTENHIFIDPFRQDDKNRPIIRERTEEPVIRPKVESIYIRPNRLDEMIRPIIRDYIKGPVIRPKDRPFPYLPHIHEIQYQPNLGEISGNNDYNDLGSREFNGRLNVDGGNNNLDENLNSQNEEELNDYSHKYPINEPSEERDQFNVVYKWHKVKVPRVDSNGNVYGWIWKTVRVPVRSKSVKNWSSTYYESRDKKHRATHWKHKSTSSKVYHHHHTTNGDISVASFDAWIKKQIRNMQNNGNKIHMSDDYIYTVKVAVEKALRTNGIVLKRGGVLIDAEGNVLRLDNIQLRPIYIGRSVGYDRIVTNSGKARHYKIPANTPFLKGLLVSVINPPRSLGIVPLGITDLPQLTSHQGHVFVDSEKELRPISIQDGLNELITGQISGVDDVSPKLHQNVLVDDSKSSSEEEPEYRIIGGSFAVGSGAPLANKGRSGKDSISKLNKKNSI